MSFHQMRLHLQSTLKTSISYCSKYRTFTRRPFATITNKRTEVKDASLKTEDEEKTKKDSRENTEKSSAASSSAGESDSRTSLPKSIQDEFKIPFSSQNVSSDSAEKTDIPPQEEIGEATAKTAEEIDTPQKHIDLLLKILFSIRKKHEQMKTQRESNELLSPFGSEENLITHEFFRLAVEFRQWFIPVQVNDIMVKTGDNFQYEDLDNIFQFIRKEKKVYLFTHQDHIEGAIELLKGIYKKEVYIKSKELSDVSLISDTFESREFDSIVINFGSPYSLTLPSEQIRLLKYWIQVRNVEMSFYYMDRTIDMAYSSEKIGDDIQADDDFPILDPISQIINFNNLYVIMDQNSGMGSEKYRLRYANFDKVGSKKFVLVFTAPDIAYRYAFHSKIDINTIKCVKSQDLFKKMKQKLDADPTYIDGIALNVGNIPKPGNEMDFARERFIPSIFVHLVNATP